LKGQALRATLDPFRPVRRPARWRAGGAAL